MQDVSYLKHAQLLMKTKQNSNLPKKNVSHYSDEIKGFTVFTPWTPQTPSGAQRVKTKSYLWKSFLLGI